MFIDLIFNGLLSSTLVIFFVMYSRIQERIHTYRYTHIDGNEYINTLFHVFLFISISLLLWAVDKPIHSNSTTRSSTSSVTWVETSLLPRLPMWTQLPAPLLLTLHISTATQVRDQQTPELNILEILNSGFCKQSSNDAESTNNYII